MEQAELDKALSKAKIGLMCHEGSVFFSTVCMSLEHIFDESVGTACTDGRYIKYAPTFFMKQSEPERIGLILHETLHVVFMHMIRKGDRNPQKFNMAADYVINLIIVDAGFKLPEGGLLDRKYVGMSAEKVYDLLPEDPPMPSDFMNDLVEPGDGSIAEHEKLTAELDDILVHATMQSEAQGQDPGSIPGDVARYVNNLLHPIVPWSRVLRNVVTKLAKTDYTFRKPNRRFFPDHLLPSLFSEVTCDPAFGADTSGSVNMHQFTHVISETAAVLKLLKPKETTFIQFDYTIKGIDKVKTVKDLKSVKFTGMGGTCIEPLMEWARDNKPPVLIVFTDGYYTEPSFNPKVPIIWIIYDNPDFTAPFGKVIHYQFRE